jgi:hypothetical protein
MSEHDSTEALAKALHAAAPYSCGEFPHTHEAHNTGPYGQAASLLAALTAAGYSLIRIEELEGLRRLLGYLWNEADVEPGHTKVCDLFGIDDPMAVEIEAALSSTPEPEGGAK